MFVFKPFKTVSEREMNFFMMDNTVAIVSKKIPSLFHQLYELKQLSIERTILRQDSKLLGYGPLNLPAMQAQ